MHESRMDILRQPFIEKNPHGSVVPLVGFCDGVGDALETGSNCAFSAISRI